MIKTFILFTISYIGIFLIYLFIALTKSSRWAFCDFVGSLCIFPSERNREKLVISAESVRHN